MTRDGQSAWYADIGAGLMLVQDSDLTDPALGGLTGTLSSDIGFMGSGSFGYKFSRHLRGEAELGFRNSGLDSVSVGGFGLGATSNPEGSVSVISLLANGYVDFPINNKFIDFGGGGIGAAAINVDIENNATDEWDTVFAYQLATGFRFEFLDRAWVRATYKFFGTSDPKINTTEGEYFSHAIEVGYYYEF
ncbi:MAG: outer membrane beta-barrel protein [Proteobacteria bacterium]|nr:outer membrane beta-barrel protein [Pseudomonadota bacterium]